MVKIPFLLLMHLVCFGCFFIGLFNREIPLFFNFLLISSDGDNKFAEKYGMNYLDFNKNTITKKTIRHPIKIIIFADNRREMEESIKISNTYQEKVIIFTSINIDMAKDFANNIHKKTLNVFWIDNRKNIGVLPDDIMDTVESLISWKTKLKQHWEYMTYEYDQEKLKLEG